MALAAITTAVADTPGVQLVVPAQLNPAGDTAVIQAIPDSSPQDAATEELVDHLRTNTIPTLEEDTGAVVEVTGTTAAFIDISKRLAGRLVVFIAAVVLLSFVLLTAVFRSPLVALKAALVNLLGISAAYGVLVAVFQWGWGLGLVGLEETVPVISFLPMMMFAILFGLSMDYEVFILSRVRKGWLASGDPTGSIVHGIAVSALVDDRGSAHHDQRLRLVRGLGDARDQDVRRRARGRGRARRDHRPHGRCARHHDPLRCPQSGGYPAGSTGSCPASTSKARPSYRPPKPARCPPAATPSSTRSASHEPRRNPGRDRRPFPDGHRAPTARTRPALVIVWTSTSPTRSQPSPAT